MVLDVLEDKTESGNLERISEEMWRLDGMTRELRDKYGIDP